MKLDNIIYDVDSLATAISEQWNTESEAFKAIYPSDAATSLVNVFAAYGAMLQYLLTAALANCYTETAFSEKGIYQLAQTLGNNLHGNVSSQVQVNITKLNFFGTMVRIPKETVFEVSGKKFFNPSEIELPANTKTVTNITLIQGEKITVNKISNGIPNEKFYFSSDFKANHNYIEVYVNGEQWSVEESFLPYDENYILDPSEANVVVLKTDPDGRSYIKVGDNRLGIMPSSGSNIQIKYVSNDGADGNIDELNATGSLISQLIYMDNTGKQDQLNVELTTITTAYGGFSKQSLEILKQSSPYVFASGNRAIRRQDYNAMLQNKCGYLTSAVWGEYEEADKQGAYDSLMMNMVYYTGLKTFKEYPYFEVGTLSIDDESKFEALLYSRKGFLGSHSIRINNTTNTTEPSIVFQDNNGKGLLFINNDEFDPRDDLLDDWTDSTESDYIAYIDTPAIVDEGTGYYENEILVVKNTNNEIRIQITEANNAGEVISYKILDDRATKDWAAENHSNVFTCDGEGGLEITLGFRQEYYSSFITTNDNIEGAINVHPIRDARSNTSDTAYYQSLFTPTLLNPVQIFIDFGSRTESITGIKFKAAPEGIFPGTFAMFATNDASASRENIRNNPAWVKVIPRVNLTNPSSNEIANHWTNWLATNCFSENIDNPGIYEWSSYRYYVLEFYSLEENNNISKLMSIGKMKIQYKKDSSTIEYNNNSKITLNFPKAGDPAPEPINDLINSDEYPLFKYNLETSGLTYENNYRNDNVLAYKYNINSNDYLIFIVKIIDIANNVYEYSLLNHNYLEGEVNVNITNEDLLTVYYLEKEEIVNPGSGYDLDDILILQTTDTLTNIPVKIKVTNINNHSTGEVSSYDILDNISVGTQYNGTYNAIGGHGSGLQVKIKAISKSGYYEGTTNIPGTGGKINISSEENLQVEASFIGNKIDSNDILYLDQPIINKYNHFTTFLEFKQPEITQIGITAYVKIVKNAPITSGIILQNVKNNIAKLFEITPDYIGKGLKLSDIYKAITNTKYVEWAKIVEPTDNVDVIMNGILIHSYINVIEDTSTIYG